MSKIQKALKWLVLNIEEIIAVTALAVMLCAIFYNVIMRYVFRMPSAWANELACICLAYVTFVGGAAAYKKNLHFGIDILVDRLPARGKLFVRQMVTFVFIFLFAYTAYLGYNLFSSAVKRMNYSGWSYKIMDAALPLGFLSMAIHAVWYFIQSFTNKAAFAARYESSYEEENVDEAVIEAGRHIFECDAQEGGDGQ